MKCPRCQGFMVRDQLFDHEGPFLHIEVWRCLNCGQTVDARPAEPSGDKENDNSGQQNTQMNFQRV